VRVVSVLTFAGEKFPPDVKKRSGTVPGGRVAHDAKLWHYAK
jgi:hypothetical protein